MEFYNEVIKKKYLDSLENEGTKHVVSYIFEASHSTENILEKDLYNFTDKEIGLVLQNMQLSTINTAIANLSLIRKYIDYCIKNGYRDNNINPLIEKNENWVAKFVDKSKKIHWSENELINLIEELPNAQDQALISLIFNGVFGEKLSELINLHYYDIDWNKNEIFIKERNTKIKVPDKCIDYIKKAYEFNIYYSLNTEGDYIEYPLVRSDYILRPVASKKSKHSEQTNASVIYARLSRIREYFELEYFTPNAIKQSGMIKMAVDLWNERGKLEKEEFQLIGDWFNLKKIHANGYEYHNRSAMKRYINEENIKNLYGIDVVID